MKKFPDNLHNRPWLKASATKWYLIYSWKNSVRNCPTLKSKSTIHLNNGESSFRGPQLYRNHPFGWYTNCGTILEIFATVLTLVSGKKPRSDTKTRFQNRRFMTRLVISQSRLMLASPQFVGATNTPWNRSLILRRILLDLCPLAVFGARESSPLVVQKVQQNSQLRGPGSWMEVFRPWFTKPVLIRVPFLCSMIYRFAWANPLQLPLVDTCGETNGLNTLRMRRVRLLVSSIGANLPGKHFELGYADRILSWETWNRKVSPQLSDMRSRVNNFSKQRGGHTSGNDFSRQGESESIVRLAETVGIFEPTFAAGCRRKSHEPGSNLQYLEGCLK